jgi:hypothetical protein
MSKPEKILYTAKVHTTGIEGFAEAPNPLMIA